MDILKARLSEPLAFGEMIGCSEAMQAVFEHVRRAARVDSTVLVRGESGTGKELVAESIHRTSRRSNGPFLAVNVAAVPDTLVESELFGHVEGAFTGAHKRRAGRFEAADGGTLFVDEIGDLPPASQAKLLRVLENHRITPVGSNESKEIDVRVIFATHRNLEKMVADGAFREDLYYRLSVITVYLPPLRERPEDIRPLVEHWLDQMCEANHRARLTCDEELMQFLESHYWPGNVRQLRNCIESMIVLSDTSTLTLSDLPPIVRSPQSDSRARCKLCYNQPLEDIVKDVVLQRLEQFKGNRVHAAHSLGISVRTLQRKLKAWEQGAATDSLSEVPDGLS